MTKQEAAARLIAAQTAANVPVITANKILKTKIDDLLAMAYALESRTPAEPIVSLITPHIVADVPALADIDVPAMLDRAVEENGQLTLADMLGAALLADAQFKDAQAKADDYVEPQTDTDDSDEADAAAVRDYLKAQFARLFAANGGNEKRGVCKALRATARAWDDSRKEFLQAAEDNGLNKANAAAEWHSGRNRGKV